ncbi:MAG TPA: glycosyltransferase N-terminal domain-containing protein [Gemmatimonadaceae bacterium]|nr:glycosyltransferase N-terminal domain-containing protein [Gemmatimonadaceae bacterium]
MHPLLGPLYAAAGAVARSAAAVLPAGGGKFRRSLAARRGVIDRFIAWGADAREPDRPLAWVHAPSVGEGLQARPVLSELRARNPSLQLAYTWYSPSAERFAASLPVDFRDVLPFDTRRDSELALAALSPDLLAFSKLDVWPVLSEAAARRGVRLALISATLPAGSSRLRGLAPLFLRDAYASLSAVGTISAEDGDRLVQLGCDASRITVTGDTRFDQVWTRARQADRGGPLLAPLVSDRPTLVAGSTWPSDEKRLLPALLRVRARNRAVRVVLAPHEPRDDHLRAIEDWCRRASLEVARLGSARAPGADVVLVERVGVLGELYALADVAFVGGAWHDAGIHSVLEPAAYGAPVAFGPRHGNSREAGLLVAEGGAASAPESEQLAAILGHWLTDRAARVDAGNRAREFVERNLGATGRTVTLLEELLRR